MVAPSGFYLLSVVSVGDALGRYWEPKEWVGYRLAVGFPDAVLTGIQRVRER